MKNKGAKLESFQIINSLDLDALEKGTLLLFLDETGQEELKDDQYPIFGYGGCGVMLEDYNELLVEPWKNLKDKCFGDPNFLFHAKDVGKPSEVLQRELTIFFETSSFSRFAAITKRSTTLDQKSTHFIATHYGVVGAIRNISKGYFNKTSVALIIESSERLNQGVDDILGKFDFASIGIQTSVNKYFLDKKAGESGLEVADYVARSSGRHAINRMSGKEPRVDSNNIFRNVDEKLQYYISIDALKYSPTSTQ